MSDILAIDANWDIVTQYGYTFREKFIFDNFQQDWPNHTITYLTETNAVYAQVNQHIDGNSVKYITGMGHGSYDTFTGYKNTAVWNANQDLSNLNGAIVHLLSCQTGATLGRQMVKQGVKAFWGYSINFCFYRKATLPLADIASDTTAEIFLKMDCIIDRGILSGKNADDIYESITDYVAKTLSQISLPIHQAVLLDNFVHLVCPATIWGDVQATLN